jgi:hypothetical protein
MRKANGGRLNIVLIATVIIASWPAKAADTGFGDICLDSPDKTLLAVARDVVARLRFEAAQKAK